MNPLVDYFRANAAIEAPRDVARLMGHFDRREALYRHLGLVPAWLRGRSVLEFGAGAGQNALYTASLRPASYRIVEPNPARLAQLRKLLGESHAETEFSLEAVSAEAFDTDQRFDLVIGDDALALRLDPAAHLRRIAGFAGHGGVVVVPCMDSVSLLTDVLRRLVAAMASDPALDRMVRAEQLLPIFAPQLATIRELGRTPVEWIAERLLAPVLGPLLPVEDAIAALDEHFDVLGASPRFLTDWRRYREIQGSAKAYNDIACGAYLRNLHNFLDFRFVSEARPAEANMRLLLVGNRLFALARRFERGLDPATILDVRSHLAELVDLCRDFQPETAAAFEDYLRLVEGWLQDRRIGDFGRFAGCFGRGVQYLSFVRR